MDTYRPEWMEYVYMYTGMDGIPAPYHVRLSLVFERPQADLYVGSLSRISLTP